MVPEGHYALSFTLNDNEFLKPFLSAEELRLLALPPDARHTNFSRANGPTAPRTP